MKKTLTIILISWALLGNPYQTFSDTGFQPTDTVETFSNGGLGDIGPPHLDKDYGVRK